MAEKGITLTAISKITKTNLGGLSRQLKKGFVLKYDRMQDVRNQLFNRSCHKLYFGVDKPVRVSKVLSAVMKDIFEKAPARSKRKIVAFLNRLYEEDHSMREEALDKARSDNLSDRVAELYADKSIGPWETFATPKGASNFKTAISNTINKEKKFKPSIENIMYLAYVHDVSLDYFFSLDYTKFNSVYYYGDDPENIIENKVTVDCISKYLQLTEESRNRFISYLISGYMSLSA